MNTKNKQIVAVIIGVISGIAIWRLLEFGQEVLLNPSVLGGIVSGGLGGLGGHRIYESVKKMLKVQELDE